MVATALARALGAEPDVHIVATVADVPDAMVALRDHEVDVVLLDLHLARTSDSSSSIPQLRVVRPDVRVIVLTGDLDPRAVTTAVSHGCDGFLIKTQPIAQLLAGIRDVVAGSRVLPPDYDPTDPYGLEYRAMHAAASAAGSGSRPGALEPVDAETLRRVKLLSARELEVLGHLAAGRSTREVADGLYLSVNTVRNHIQNAMEKLDAHTRLEAVSIAVRAGVVDLA